MPDRSPLNTNSDKGHDKENNGSAKESLKNYSLRVLNDDKTKCKSIQSGINQK